MVKNIKYVLVVQSLLLLMGLPAMAGSSQCERFLREPNLSKEFQASLTQVQVVPMLHRLYTKLPNKVVKSILHTMAYFKGLPRYFKKIEHLRQSGDYLKYTNFGEMGLAEIGISLRYNQAKFEGLNTGRPLIIIGNHHLGIADGLALQHLMGQARLETPSLLFLARWIEKLLPHAVFGDEHGWGTAVPIDINTPKSSDPDHNAKTLEINKFNSSWSRVSLKALKNGGALIVFPAGHVASINSGDEVFPDNVYDAPNSWQEGFLNLARVAKADIVFANLMTVNSQAFYKKRKRFGGGDLERVIWFFSEALAKKGQVIDIELSEPLGLSETYERLSEAFNYSKETLLSDHALTAELMRQYTYNLSLFSPQTLDTLDSPQKK